jgi:hypothetical protein
MSEPLYAADEPSRMTDAVEKVGSSVGVMLIG